MYGLKYEYYCRIIRRNKNKTKKNNFATILFLFNRNETNIRSLKYTPVFKIILRTCNNEYHYNLKFFIRKTIFINLCEKKILLA